MIQVRSQNTLYVDRLLDYPLNQIIEGTIKPSTITWTIFNSTLDCIPTPPPYFSVPKFSLTRFQPHQYVCQNRSDRGSSYRGVQNHALDAQGRPLECQEWDVIEPQYHSSTSSGRISLPTILLAFISLKSLFYTLSFPLSFLNKYAHSFPTNGPPSQLLP